MSWEPIVVGVDASPEAAGAAAFAVRMSQQAGTTCHLVHAARDVWASVGVEEGVDALWHALVDQARASITAVLAGVVPRELVDKMTVRLGRAPVVLKQTVTDLGAGLVVPGAERLVRYGRPVETLLREATTWQADLLVVGSHGRGWAERVLVGSVTERLLNHLPTSVLVVPVGAAAVVEPPDARLAAAVA